MRHSTGPVSLLGFCVFLSACELMTGPNARRFPGILEWERDVAPQTTTPAAATSRSGGTVSTTVSAPDTVRAGVPFEAVITTIGPDGCWKASEITIERNPRLVVATPYDVYAWHEGIGCLDMRTQLRHPVQITFTEPGEAALRVHGRKVVGRDVQAGTPIMVEKRIHVR